MRHYGDDRPPIATNRSQVTRFHLVRFNAIEENLSQQFHRKVGVNDFDISRVTGYKVAGILQWSCFPL